MSILPFFSAKQIFAFSAAQFYSSSQTIHSLFLFLINQTYYLFKNMMEDFSYLDIWPVAWSFMQKWKWKSLTSVQLFAAQNSLVQNTGVGSLSLLQRTSQPRDRTQVLCFADGFFTSWAIREAQEYWGG